MDGNVYYLQICKAKDVLSVKSFYLQLIDPIPDILAAPLLNVPVPIITGPVQTDKHHAAHKLYCRTKLLMYYQAATYSVFLSSIMVFSTLFYLTI
jgi:hypothetical protein